MGGCCRFVLRESRIYRGFTLMELLVVIAVLAVLAALLLPALGRAKATARSVSCMSNLKQWGVATHLYAGEHGDFLPPDGAPNGTSTKSGWYIDLPRAIEIPAYPELPWRDDPSISPGRSIWVCPSSTNRSNGLNLFFYCLNQHVNRTGAQNRPVPLDSISRPDRMVWLFDNGRRAAVAQQNNVALDVHRDGANFLFVDGHTARYRRTAYWNSERKRGRTDNPELQWVP